MFDMATGSSLIADLAASLATAFDQAASDDYKATFDRLRLIALGLTFSGIALTAFQYLKGDDIRRVAMSAATVVALMLTSIILSFYTP